jgi:FdrA protein
MHVTGLVQTGSYVDSIALMQVAEALRRLPGVAEAAVLMGTEANRAMLAEAGIWPAEAEGAGPDDLVIAVRAEGRGAGQAALREAAALLGRRRRGDRTDLDVPARSIAGAVRRVPDANLAVISVPGDHAAAETHQALSAGLHVFLFSDGVSLGDELALKQRARARGLLVMGPECGTSIVGGVGVGFANRVRRGPIGLVGASGTGLQEVTSLVHRLGGGISHAIGTGGRDLHEAVGGLTTLQALELLAADHDTGVVVLISKPASSAVADRVLAAARAVGKPVIACLLGWRGAVPPGVCVAETLEEAALAALEATSLAPSALEPPKLPPPRRPAGKVLGLYTGGTLCDEAQGLVAEAGLRFVDFGGRAYTRGRPHPMIDPSLRAAAVAAAGDDDAVGVLLIDVVLGHGAHRDPAGAVGPAIARARAGAERRGRPLEVVAHVVGTDEDPQRLGEQEAVLRALDVLVSASNRQAALAARALAGGA